MENIRAGVKEFVVPAYAARSINIASCMVRRDLGRCAYLVLTSSRWVKPPRLSRRHSRCKLRNGYASSEVLFNC